MLNRRYIVAVLLATAITLSLFWVMQSLISQKQKGGEVANIGKLIDFVKLRQDSSLETRQRKLPEKQEPEQAPPPPAIDMSSAEKPDAGALEIGSPDMNVNVNLGGPQLGAFQGDAEAVPLVRVQPVYPERALSRGIEGWVDIGFTVTVTGSVKDEHVIDAEPSSIFNRAALKAVRKFKYKPKVVDGHTVEQLNQRIRLTFEVDK